MLVLMSEGLVAKSVLRILFFKATNANETGKKCVLKNRKKLVFGIPYFGWGKSETVQGGGKVSASVPLAHCGGIPSCSTTAGLPPQFQCGKGQLFGVSYVPAQQR